MIDEFAHDFRAKYEAGQAEHGGRLWTKPGLLDEAIKEVIDLACYLYTLKRQLRDQGLLPAGAVTSGSGEDRSRARAGSVD